MILKCPILMIYENAIKLLAFQELEQIFLRYSIAYKQ